MMHDGKSAGEKLLDRLHRIDPELIRLDVSTSLLESLSSDQIKQFLQVFPCVTSIQSVHLSGLDLDSVLTAKQIEEMVLGIASMQQLQDLCVFRGGSTVLTEDMLATLLQNNTSLRTLLLWQFASFHDHPSLAGALRQHHGLQRLTITLPQNLMPWACMDVYAMAFCAMPALQVLQIRCTGGKQSSDAIVSPEAMRLLLNSPTLTSLYLENCGLLDDHMDVLYDELPGNHTLQLLDFKDNLLTDDTLYTIARTLPNLTPALYSIDVSGVEITPKAGWALARAIAKNTTLTHLELEGTAERFADEFDIPVSHSRDDWALVLYYHLRLNRARRGAGDATDSRSNFVESLNMVSDQLDCLYHFVRTFPKHCDRHGKNTIYHFNPMAAFK